MNENILFCIGMAVLCLICCLYFVGFMSSYKKRRFQNNNNKFNLNIDITTGIIMLSFPIATYIFFFKYLKKKVNLKF